MDKKLIPPISLEISFPTSKGSRFQPNKTEISAELLELGKHRKQLRLPFCAYFTVTLVRHQNVRAFGREKSIDNATTFNTKTNASMREIIIN